MENDTMLVIRLPKELKDKLKEIADTKPKTSLAWLIRVILDDYISERE